MELIAHFFNATTKGISFIDFDQLLYLTIFFFQKIIT